MWGVKYPLSLLLNVLPALVALLAGLLVVLLDRRLTRRAGSYRVGELVRSRYLLVPLLLAVLKPPISLAVTVNVLEPTVAVSMQAPSPTSPTHDAHTRLLTSVAAIFAILRHDEINPTVDEPRLAFLPN